MRRLTCAANCEPLKGSLCHRCPAHRLVPSGRPRAFGHALIQREPRDPGLPFRLSPGKFSKDASDNKKPSGASGSGGSVMSGLSISLFKRDRSQSPGMRYRSAGGRSRAVRSFRARIASSGSPLFRKHFGLRGRGTYARACRLSIVIERETRNDRAKPHTRMITHALGGLIAEEFLLLRLRKQPKGRTMTVLVSGSSGHLGEGLMRRFRSEGRQARGIDIKPSPFTDLVGSICD